MSFDFAQDEQVGIGGISQAPRTAGATDVRRLLQTVCFPGCAMADTTTQPLKKTALHALHVEYGGELV